MLFETRERRFYFHDGTVEWEELSGIELARHRYYRSVLLLVDHQQGQPPPFCAAFTVAPVSPICKLQGVAQESMFPPVDAFDDATGGDGDEPN